MNHGLGQADVRIERQIVYIFQARIADRWRDRRIFLAGDAAHTMPPNTGQGPCSGMRDAATLAWKLDLVLTGRAGEELLDTYESERRPHATTITETAVMLGHVANTDDHPAPAARDGALRLGKVPRLPPIPPVINGVVSRDADAQPAGLAGTLAPQGWVVVAENQGRFDDLTGYGFAVVAKSDPRAALGAEQLTFLDELGAATASLQPGTPGSFTDIDGVYEEYFHAHDVDFFISRPDFRLFGAGRMRDLPRLIDELRDALAWKSGADRVPTRPKGQRLTGCAPVSAATRMSQAN